LYSQGAYLFICLKHIQTATLTSKCNYKGVMIMRLLKVTQDGAAILYDNNTDDNIDGLYTNDLKSCIALLINGKKGIALIHDSGRLEEKSIINVFKLISPIRSWSIAHNPNSDRERRLTHQESYYKKYGNKGIFKTRYDKIHDILKQHMGEKTANRYSHPTNRQFHEVTNDCACITKSRNISTNQVNDNELYQPSGLEKRYLINCLNNSSMRTDDDRFDVDLQYDGQTITTLPEFIYSPDEIKTFAKQDFIIRHFIESYCDLLKKELNDQGYHYYQQEGFFSPSRHANQRNPYGPYSDHYCHPDDSATQITNQLTAFSM